jgi:hypothetical protein
MTRLKRVRDPAIGRHEQRRAPQGVLQIVATEVTATDQCDRPVRRNFGIFHGVVNGVFGNRPQSNGR